MRAIGRAARVLDAVVAALCIALTLAMVVLVVAAVVMRYAVGAPLTYSYDLSTLLFAWIVFLGLAVAERDGAHLAVDVLDDALRPRARRTLRVCRKLASAGLALAVAWIGWQLFRRSGMIMPSMRISIGWLYASLPLGFALYALAQVLSAVLGPADEEPAR